MGTEYRAEECAGVVPSLCLWSLRALTVAALMPHVHRLWNEATILLVYFCNFKFSTYSYSISKVSDIKDWIFYKIVYWLRSFGKPGTEIKFWDGTVCVLLLGQLWADLLTLNKVHSCF